MAISMRLSLCTSPQALLNLGIHPMFVIYRNLCMGLGKPCVHAILVLLHLSHLGGLEVVFVIHRYLFIKMVANVLTYYYMTVIYY